MCYSIPGKVESIQDKIVTVSYFGQIKKARNELHDLLPGDYVYAQGGYILQKIAVPEAEDILAAWQDVFRHLGELDERISPRAPADGKSDTGINGILGKASREEPLSPGELLSLLSVDDPAGTEQILKTANFLRRKFHQNACCVHGIIEISNHCARNCVYCGISGHNSHLTLYRMNKEEILAAVKEAVEVHGFKGLVLQSGEDPGYSIDELAEIIAEIRRRHAVLIVISFGEIQEQGLEKLFTAGARGLLMRFETSNPRLYRELHPGYTLEARLEHLRGAYRMGYLIFTGGLIGLPGQTRRDIINDIFLTKELHAEMVSFGPFLPHPYTPLAGNAAPDEQEILKTLALARMVVEPDAKIVVTTAFETLTAEARQKGLLAGANSVMINVTSVHYRGFYSIYPARAHREESVSAQVKETVALLQSVGRVPMDVGMVRDY